MGLCPVRASKAEFCIHRTLLDPYGAPIHWAVIRALGQGPRTRANASHGCKQRVSAVRDLRFRYCKLSTTSNCQNGLQSLLANCLAGRLACDGDQLALAMHLSMRIRVARQHAKLSQEALALTLGVSRGAVANWECSVGNQPSTHRLSRLACATNVQFEWLATGRGSMLYQALDADVPAADAEFVDDPLERKLLQAFRISSRDVRRMFLSLATEQLSATYRKRA